MVDSSAPVNAASTKSQAPMHLSRKRKWLFRLIAIVVGPALVFGILEVSLRAIGYGYSTSFFVDGSKIEGKPAWIDNPQFGLWVYPRRFEGGPKPLPFVLPKVKASKTYRIFVLGESAALGFPDPSVSFARVLEVMLRAAYPDTHFEVVNCSMVAINSHAALQVARQCADYEPDLIVVHLGNNEVVGPNGAAGVLGPFAGDIRVIRANLALKRSRVGQLVDAIVRRISEGKQKKQGWLGMKMVNDSNRIKPDDPRLPQNYANFRSNLEGIVRAGRGVGAQVVLCTIPVNLRDFGPFGSVHAAELSGNRLEQWEKSFKEGVRFQSNKQFAEALNSYREAESIDNGHAELQFREAQCMHALAQYDQARGAFIRARDLDVLRFRADTTINGITREVAAANKEDGVRLVDADLGFGQTDPAGAPGSDLFLEHVHMTFAGNYLLAKEVFDSITHPALPGLDKSASEPVAVLSEQQAGDMLGHTSWADLKFQNEMYERLILEQPFTLQAEFEESRRGWQARLDALKSQSNPDGKAKALAILEHAVNGSQDDWMIRKQYGELLFDRGKLPEAEHELEETLARCRHCWDVQCQLGNLELMENRLPAAEQRFRNVLEHNPAMESAFVGLVDTMARAGRTDEALVMLEEKLRDDPNSVSVIKTAGLVLFRAGKLDEAKARFNRALEVDPTDADSHLDLGLIAMKEKHLDEAVDEFHAALKIKPGLPQAIKLLQAVEQERK